MAEHQQRMRIITMISLAAALLILGRYAVLMLSPNRENPDPPPSPARTERGSIVDRNGRLVAMQTRLWSVTAWLPDVEDTAVTASLLAPLIDEDADELSRKMTNARSRFLYVKRQIPPSQSDAVKRLISEGKLPGIGLQEELGRHYPMKELGASVVGYVGTDNVGLAGIEYAFDRELSPQGIVTGDSILRGNTVHLTLDMDTQYLVDRIAQEAWEEHQPDSLMVLVMDATNGALRSWTSLPQFDPNTFGSFSGEERMNRPLVEAYEPGSVFKIFSWSALLDAGVVQPEERFDTTGGYAPEIFQKYDIAPITDLGAYGTLDVTGALVRSSNVAVAMATERRDKNAFYSDLKNFGFGVPTGIPLTGESNGILYAPSRWSPRSKPTIAIGQEVAVSALQMASAATVLANGGILLKPRIVSQVTAPDGSVIMDYPRTPIREVISPKTAQTMLEMMKQTVDSPVGTSKLAAVPGLSISAKSGTAQIADPETGAYSEDRFLSSVLALFPTENPKLIVYVVLENPRGSSIYGARTAAPVVQKIATALAPLYGIPIAGNSVMNHSGQVRVAPLKNVEIGDTLPDFSGYSKRRLLPYLERDDIMWTLYGSGWVVFQVPPPGTPIQEGMPVFLELR